MSFLGQPLRWRASREKGSAGATAFLRGVLTVPAMVTAVILISVALSATPALAQSLGHRDAPETERGAVPPASLPTWLPNEATETYRLILSGGPFPHAKDGVVFGNREHLLPAKRRGFYHEYTVPTPRAHDRGARRIVCGGNPPVRPQACYYTGDHYASFQLITG